MRDRLAFALERFKDRSARFGLWVQARVVRILLFLIYVVGVGLTRLTAEVMARRYLVIYNNHPEKASFWIDAEGYESSAEGLRRQF